MIFQPVAGKQEFERRARWQVYQDFTEQGPGFDAFGFAAGDECHQDGRTSAGTRAAIKSPFFLPTVTGFIALLAEELSWLGST